VVTIDDVRALLTRLPRCGKVLVRDLRSSVSGQIVQVAFSALLSPTVLSEIARPIPPLRRTRVRQLGGPGRDAVPTRPRHGRHHSWFPAQRPPAPGPDQSGVEVVADREADRIVDEYNDIDGEVRLPIDCLAQALIAVGR
jgi:hypothetical protein